VGDAEFLAQRGEPGLVRHHVEGRDLGVRHRDHVLEFRAVLHEGAHEPVGAGEDDRTGRGFLGGGSAHGGDQHGRVLDARHHAVVDDRRVGDGAC